MPSSIFQSFNSFFDRIFRGNKNAHIVGFHKQIVGEFPLDIPFKRLYEFYDGWAQIKRAVDTEHQKFMGSGMKVTSKNKKFNTFIKEWWSIVQADKKIAQAILTLLITGNFIIERQYTEDGRLGNLEHIPMTTIYKIFRDSFGNELKLQQIIDGVLLDLDPKYYIHHMINNPDRQAFGRSEFHTVAVPRRVTTKVDPNTGSEINPERSMISILDAYATLQNLQVEIMEKLSKPKIFASFPGMPQTQLQDLRMELEDPLTDKYVWAFNKEAKIAEAAIHDSTKFDMYFEKLENQIDLAGVFGSKVITNPSGFGYASVQTSVDVLDQRMMVLQQEVIEVIRDGIIKPLAESWGWKDFETLDVSIVFSPTVRRLTIEDIIAIPDNVVSPLEKREMLEEQNVMINDELYEEWSERQMAPVPPVSTDIVSDTDKPTTTPSMPKERTTPERPPIEKNAPKPTPNKKFVEFIMRNPQNFESYIDRIVEAKVEERLNMSPLGPARGDHDDQFKEKHDTEPDITSQAVDDEIENLEDIAPNETDSMQNSDDEVDDPADEVPEEEINSQHDGRQKVE